MPYQAPAPVSTRYGAPMGRDSKYGERESCADCGATFPRAMFGLCTCCGGPNLRPVAPAPGEAPPRVKMHLRRIRLDSGGYDSGGAYWGHGAPLWHAMAAEGGLESFFRAGTREKAKAEVRAALAPGAVFYR